MVFHKKQSLYGWLNFKETKHLTTMTRWRKPWLVNRISRLGRFSRFCCQYFVSFWMIQSFVLITGAVRIENNVMVNFIDFFSLPSFDILKVNTLYGARFKSWLGGKGIASKYVYAYCLADSSIEFFQHHLAKHRCTKCTVPCKFWNQAWYYALNMPLDLCNTKVRELHYFKSFND